jgi:ribosome-associated heat shock protein Hsp15
MAAEGSLRLDKWLWFARFAKTRTLAAKVAEDRLRLNGQVVTKAAQAVRPGDVLTFSLSGRVRVVRVVALGARRGPPAEARLLYDDLSPPLPPREAHVPEMDEDEEV